MTADTEIVFFWEKRRDRYRFWAEVELTGDADRFNTFLAEVARWCRAQRLEQGSYRFQASRTATTEKVEQFADGPGRPGFSGQTTFHPARLKVEVELPDSHGTKFPLAFPVTDARA